LCPPSRAPLVSQMRSLAQTGKNPAPQPRPYCCWVVCSESSPAPTINATTWIVADGTGLMRGRDSCSCQVPSQQLTGRCCRVSQARGLCVIDCVRSIGDKRDEPRVDAVAGGVADQVTDFFFCERRAPAASDRRRIDRWGFAEESGKEKPENYANLPTKSNRRGSGAK